MSTEIPNMVYEPALDNNPWGVACIVINGIFLALSALAIVIRLYARRVQQATLCFNDYAVTLAWPLTAGLSVTAILAASPGGGGKHIIYVNPLEIPGALKGYIAAEILWAAANVCVKLSILHLYKCIFGLSKTFRYTVYSVMAFVAAFGLSVILTPFAICRPFAKNWDPLLPGECGSTVAAVLATSVINLCVDLVIITLPMPMIWRLHMSRTKKIALTICFSLGLIVCVVTSLRIAASTTIIPADFTYSLAKLAIVTDLEPMLGIIVACLPLFPPAFRHVTRDKDDIGTHNVLSSAVIRLRTRSKNSAFRRVNDSYPLTDISKGRNDNRIWASAAKVPSLGDDSGHYSVGQPGSAIRVDQEWEVSTEAQR